MSREQNEAWAMIFNMRMESPLRDRQEGVRLSLRESEDLSLRGSDVHSAPLFACPVQPSPRLAGAQHVTALRRSVDRYRVIRSTDRSAAMRLPTFNSDPAWELVGVRD